MCACGRQNLLDIYLDTVGTDTKSAAEHSTQYMAVLPRSLNCTNLAGVAKIQRFCQQHVEKAAITTDSAVQHPITSL